MEILEGGRRADPVTGETQPWYTHAALDEVQRWKLAGKTVLEWGGGSSSLWWAGRCGQVFTIDDDLEWCAWIRAQAASRGLANLSVIHRPSNLPADDFTRVPEGCAPDIVVIDGARRIECLARAVTLPRPLTVIFDNWRKGEPSFWHGGEALMAPYAGISYAQHDAYVGHEPWQTAIWRLPADPGPVRGKRAPRGPVLSPGWSGAEIERRFAGSPPGLAVIDEVLLAETLEALRRLGLDESLWPERPHLRSGSDVEMHHPLLDQLADELGGRLPNILGHANPPRGVLARRRRRADPAEAGMRRYCAGIGVTFWLTPPRAEADDEGMIFYGVRPPRPSPGGPFESRESRPLRNGLRLANAVTVPHRENRAVIFDADLLHENSEPRASPGSEPVSFTLLFGYRRPEAARAAAPIAVPAAPAWRRSAAFVRART